MKMMSNVSPEPPPFDEPAPTKKAIVTTVVSERAAPATKAAEFRR